MPRKQRHRRASELVEEEPNLLPLLNICLMLILALISISTFVPLSFISAQSPKLSGGGAAEAPKIKPQDPTVIITLEGYEVLAYGKKHKTITLKTIENQRLYDLQKLYTTLVSLKRRAPKDLRLFLSAEGDVEYEQIVDVMDAARNFKTGELLFPDIAFVARVAR